MRQYINLLLEEFNTSQFLERVRGVMELIRRGAYTGERVAAKHAFKRLIDRAKIEVARMRESNSGVTHAQIDHFTQALERLTSGKTDPPKAKAKVVPKFRVGQWVMHTTHNKVGKITRIHVMGGRGVHDIISYDISFADSTNTLWGEDFLRAATQNEIDAATAKKAKTTGSHDSGFNIISMARYINPAENSNKVYGVIQRLSNGKIYTFWGGYHKALKVKYFAREEDADVQFKLKVRNGYRELSQGVIEITEVPWVTNALRTEFTRLGESRKELFMPTIRDFIDLVEAFGRKGVDQGELVQARKYPSAEAYADANNPIGVTNTDPPRLHAIWKQNQDSLIAKWNQWHDMGMLGGLS